MIDQHIAHINGVDLAYEIDGTGEPVLLIHGLGSSRADWQPQLAALSRYRVVRYDVRGHGASSRPASGYDLPTLADDAAALIRALDLGAAHVVGLSLGGMIGLQLAVSGPELVRSLTIVNSGPEVVGHTRQEKWQLATRLLLTWTLGPRHLGKLLAKRLFVKPDQEPLRREFIAQMAKNDRHAYLATTRAILGWSVVDRLADDRVPGARRERRSRLHANLAQTGVRAPPARCQARGHPRLGSCDADRPTAGVQRRAGAIPRRPARRVARSQTGQRAFRPCARAGLSRAEPWCPARRQIALCDDHPVFRGGLVGLLHQETDLRVVIEAGSTAELFAQLATTPADLVVLDVQLPSECGLAAIEKLVGPRRVLVLSAFDDPSLVKQALKAGAQGFVRKDASPRVLIKAIADAAAGRTVLAADLALKLAESLRAEPDRLDFERRVRALTTRQREVLSLLSDGRSNREVAGALFVSEGTIKNHVTQILQALGVRDRTRLAVLLARYGIECR